MKKLMKRGLKMLTITAMVLLPSCKVPYSSMGDPTITGVEYKDEDSIIVHCQGDYMNMNYLDAFLRIVNDEDYPKTQAERTSCKSSYQITSMTEGHWEQNGTSGHFDGYNIQVDVSPDFTPGTKVHVFGTMNMIEGSGEFTVPEN